MGVLKKVLESGGFALTAETGPPKGCDFSGQIKKAELLKGAVHAVNVTDMQGASVRASSLGMCIRLKETGLEPIFQITGRDRSRIAIMGELFSAAAFGIDSVIAVTGDHPALGDCPQSKPVYDLDSVGILHMLSMTEQTGKDCGGNDLEGGVPSFYKGAVATPSYEPLFLQINKLRQKVQAGASFIQTQGVFDLETLKRFMDETERAGIHVHVLAGIIPLKSAGMASFMNVHIPGIRVPDAMMQRLADAAAEGKQKGIKGLPAKLGMEMAAEMIAKIKDERLCSGVHLMTVGAEEKVPVILKMAGMEKINTDA